jgi:predicted nucleic acid-binding protein
MVNEQVTDGAQWTHFDPYCSGTSRLIAITDTNALFSSIVHDSRTGRRSRLLKMTASGTSVLYAPDHVYDEVYEHLPDISEASGRPVSHLRAQFEEHYLPILRFVTVADEQITDPQVLAISDPDDVPTGQLAKLISPCIVFSDDKHLRKPGFAVANWPKIAGHAVDLAEGLSKQNVAGGVVAAPGYVVTGLIRFFSRQLGTSPWLTTATAAAAAGLLLRSPDRRARFGRAFERYGVPLVQAVADTMNEARIQQQSGIKGLRGVVLPAPSEPSVKQQVAIMLARHSEPLLATEIRDLVQQHFFANGVPSVTEIRTVLRSNPEFEPYRRYRWKLGRYLAPPGQA